MKSYQAEKMRTMRIKSDCRERIIKIEGLTNFHPRHIFECGQAFRWNWDGKGYKGVVSHRVVRILWDGSTLIIENATLDDFDILWRDYFDLDTDYGEIIKTLSCDDVLREAVKYGWGIRILNQDPWETLISFIISANNGITRIKGIIEKLSYRFGKKITWKDQEYYCFPSVESLARAHKEELRGCGCGYRDTYIQGTARLIMDGIIDLDALRNLDYKDARDQLLQCPGVGPKVADCILLFSLKKPQAFPVDLWIRRIIETLYLDDKGSINDIHKFAESRFGSLAGYAQQYLFYYARENKIGK